MSDKNKIKMRLLQDDCSGYNIEGKNGSTHEIDSELAERMIASGHAAIVEDKKVTDKK